MKDSNKYPRLSLKQKIEVLFLYENNFNTVDIARHYNKTKESITGLVKRHQIKKKSIQEFLLENESKMNKNFLKKLDG